jgi:threonine synthase
MIHCTSCNFPYPDQGVPYHCPVCGGVFDAPSIIYQPVNSIKKVMPGIWRYRNTFGLPDDASIVSLGEGNTPLVWADVFGRQVAFKCEYQNPTGSFKDRGTSTLVSFLLSRGVTQAVEDSSGNAGASFAAYASRAGIKARIYVPESASGPKRRQIEAYGAEVVAVPGSRSNAAETVRREADTGVVYASHACMPFNLPGYATIAYEIVEQMGVSPGTLICPAGQGGLLLGAAQGFAALQAAGIIRQPPKLIGVQALACAPLYGLYQSGVPGLESARDESTLAEGIRVRFPVRAQAVVQAVMASRGGLIAVAEADILPGRDELAHRGFYVETTSAVVWGALAQTMTANGIDQMPEPVVVVLTGSGLKTA